jgi:molybdopterin-guanine dinucleotide biosynthesis protein A
LHVFETMQTLFEDVLIVTHQPVDFESFDGTVVSDIVGGAGALGGLLTALVHARAERCFVVGCDMPFLNAALIRRMLEKSAGHDVVVPVLGGDLQPLHAVYSKRCIPHIQERIAVGAFRIFDFYPKVSTLRLDASFWESIDPQNLSFANINTREEWLRAERMWEDGR